MTYVQITITLMDRWNKSTKNFARWRDFKMKLKINQGVLPLHQKTTGANDQVSRGIWIGINIHLTSSRRNIFGNTKSNTCTKNLFTSEISTKTVIQIFSPKYWNSQQLLKWQEIRLCHNGAWRIQRNLPISIFNNISPKTGSDFWMGRHPVVL